MNVQTHLKAGGLVQDARTGAGQAVASVERAVSAANRQASELARSVLGASTKAANCLATTFNWR